MGAERQRFVLFMCFETDQEDAFYRSMALVSGQAEIEKWKNRHRQTASTNGEPDPASNDLDSNESEEDTDNQPQEPSAELSKLMNRFRETISSYRHLVPFGMNIMPTLRSHFISNEIHRNANRYLELLDKDEQFEVYGITEDQYTSVTTQIRRLREIDRGVTVLPGAILLSLVATFDSFIADTLRFMLRSSPERVIDSSKTVNVRDVLNMSSFDEMVGKIIDDEVETIMRGSHDEQIKYIEKKLNLKIRNYYGEWGNFIEIFERRNLIAHGNFVINSHYINNCNKHGFKVSEDQYGKRLILNEQYLRRSSDRLLEFGLSLMFSLWLKHFQDSRDTAYEDLNALTYELIKDGQSRVAAGLLDLALFKKTPCASDLIQRMMTINLANSYKKLGNDTMAQKVISGVDWSATTDEFQICVAAVRGNVERVVELMPKVARGDLIKKSQFREWPVFDWVREEERVRGKFLEIYNEPIIDPTDEEQSRQQENPSPAGGSDTSPSAP